MFAVRCTAFGIFVGIFLFALGLIGIHFTNLLPPSQEGPTQTVRFNPQNSVATLELFLPSKKNNCKGSVIIFPGGGYEFMDHYNATVFANWLAHKGILTLILNYRLPRKGNYLPTLADAVNGVSYLRMQAARWNIDPDKIAVMGFSAGGHLACMVATHAQYNDEHVKDKSFSASSRPNLQILISPLISMDNKITHQLSRKNFLGKNPLQSSITFFSGEKQVHPLVPPTFISHCQTDNIVPVINSDKYVTELKKSGVPVEYIRGCVLQSSDGGHGSTSNHIWMPALTKWLQRNQFIP